MFTVPPGDDMSLVLTNAMSMSSLPPLTAPGQLAPAQLGMMPAVPTAVPAAAGPAGKRSCGETHRVSLKNVTLITLTAGIS